MSRLHTIFPLAIALIASSASAQVETDYCEEDAPGPPGDDKGGAPDPCDPDTAGDPAHIANGYAYHGIDLLQFDAGGGVRLRFYVAYNSGGWEYADSDYAFGSANADWSHSLDSFILPSAGFQVLRGPNGHLYVFRNVINADGYYDALEETNVTRLRRVGSSSYEYEWIQESGETWVFGPTLYAGAIPYLTEIRDSSGTSRVEITRDAVVPRITRVDLPTYATRLHFDNDAGNSDRLYRIRIDGGSGTTASTIWDFTYASSGATFPDRLESTTDALGNETDFTYLSNGQGDRLSAVRRTNGTDTTTVAEFGWNGDGLVEEVHDPETWVTLTYDTVNRQTTITDEAHGATRASAVYRWRLHGTDAVRRVSEIVPGATPLSCVHCERGTAFQYDRVQNRVATRDVENVWTTWLYDVDAVVVYRSGSGVANVNSSWVLTDAGADFVTAGVKAGDVFRYYSGGDRGCKTPVSGQLCVDEWTVTSVPSSTTLELENNGSTGPTTGSYDEYWILSTSEYSTLFTESGTGLVKERYLLEDAEVDFPANVSVGDTVKLYNEDSSLYLATTISEVLDARWIALADDASSWTGSEYDVVRNGVDVLADQVADGVLNAVSVHRSGGFDEQVQTGDEIVTTGTVATGAVLDVMSAKLLRVDLADASYSGYTLRRLGDPYSHTNGQSALKVIENDTRWNGTSCVADYDPWTEPTGTCAANARITRYRYGHAHHPTWRTAEERDSTSTTSGRKFYRIYDYDPTPTVATPTCSNVPADFDVTSSETQAHRLQRVIEIGWTNDSTFAEACTVRVTKYTYGSSAPYALTEVDGPLAGTDDRTTFAYYTTGLNKGRLEYVRRYTSATAYVETRFGDSGCSRSGYDHFGNPLTTKAPNLTVTCLYYDVMGRLSETRRASAPTTTVVKVTYQQDGEVATLQTETGLTYQYEYGGGEVGTGNAGLLTAIEQWSAPASGTLLAKGELEYETSTSDDNQVKYRSEYSRYPTEGLSCAANSDCSADGSVVCTSNVCVAKSCTSDSDCSGGAVCEESRCRALTRMVGYIWDSMRQPSGLKTYRTSTTRASPDATRDWESSAVGRLKRVREENKTSGDWNVRHEYNAFGEPLALHRDVASTEKKLVEYERDVRGNVKTLKYYDTSATLLSTTTYRYDDFGALIEVVSPDAGTVKYQNDAAGRVERKRDALSVTTVYERDSAGRLTKINYATDTDTAATYDETSSGPTLEDCATASGSGNISWPTRNGTGRITKIVDRVGTTYFNYDAQGRIVSRYQVRSILSETCARAEAFTYDSSGRLETERYPTGREVKWIYGGADPSRPSKVQVKFNGSWTDLTTFMSYDESGAVRRINFANGLVQTYDRFLDGAPKAREAKDGATTIMKRSVAAVHALGSPTDIDGLNAATSETFTYDADFHRLLTAQVDTHGTGSPYRSQTFDYLPSLLGDRDDTEQDIGGGLDLIGTYDYAASSSKLTEYISHETDGAVDSAWEKRVLGYNAAGQQDEVEWFSKDQQGQWVSAGIDSYGYDDAGRLESISGPDGNGGTTGVAFERDHRNMLAYWEFDAVRPMGVYFHSDENRLLGEIGCASEQSCTWPRPIQEYVWLNGEIIGAITATMPERGAVTDTARFYVHGGLLGEPRAITRHDKSVAWTLDIPPFGRTDDQSPTTTAGDGITMNLGLPGQMLLMDEMHDNWHRTYRAHWGRYLEPEPVLLRPSFHERLRRIGYGLQSYSYALASPLSWIDPTGLWVINNSDEPILVKPEDGSYWGWLPPGRIYDGQVDAVYVPETGERRACRGANWTPENDFIVDGDGLMCVSFICHFWPKEWPSPGKHPEFQVPENTQDLPTLPSSPIEE